MYHPAPTPDDVSIPENNRDRLYWATILYGKGIPGPRPKGYPVAPAERPTRPLGPGTQPLPQTQELADRPWMTRGA